MKKIALVFGIALAFSTPAMANDIAFYVGNVNTDGWYDSSEFEDVNEIIAAAGSLFKEIKKFDDKQLTDFAAWVDKNEKDGELDIIWLNGCTPSVLYALGNSQPDGSRAEKWLDGGNMIINVADWFAYISYETGSRASPENTGTGAANILDLNSNIIAGGGQGLMTPTFAGATFLPSLNAVSSDRPIQLSSVVAPWEVAAVFAQNSAGTYADPVVIHNTKTDGYVAFINQGSTGNWIADRGITCGEFIRNWVASEVGIGPQPLARKPTPKDNSMIEVTYIQASWKAGDYAKLHDVYFGESFDAVSAATTADTAVYFGRQAVTQLMMGKAPGVVPTGLVPGKTYYWRVDEIDTANPASPWKGNVWRFTVRPATAWKPTPYDGEKYVDPNQDLNWEKGLGTIYHTVYFGKTFDEVNNPDPMSGNVTSTTPYDVSTLALDTTYYWRVDEFAWPGAKTFQGPVWSFTTRGTGGGAKAQYFSGMALAGAPILTRIESSINGNWGSGEVAAGLSDLISARWTATVQAPSTEPYRIIATSDDGVRLWFDGRLVVDSWVDQGTTDHSATINLVAGQIYSIVMEWYENGGGAVAQLSWETPTRTRQIIPQGWLQLSGPATGPYPANTAVDVAQAPILRWIASGQAASQELYFGTDKDAVTNGTTPTARPKVDETTYDPGTLEWGKTYYWRVDEVNAAETASPWKGVTWSFTTANFLVIDDFETYTDEVGERIFQTWLDGLGYTEPQEVLGNGTNSAVGNAAPPFAEQRVVHTGSQSMPMDYNDVISPNYSEASRTWTSPQDWTVNGMNTLVLFIDGVGTNGADQLYVALEDKAAKLFVVNHPDKAAVQASNWIEWKIPLSQFTAGGVNVAAIKKMYIGVGDRKNPKAGGAGHLYFDDFRVIKE